MKYPVYILNSMNQNTKLLVLLVFFLIVPLCLSDLTGAHYLHTINCSSSTLYIPQGPYLFSHHWPFTSITIQYQKQSTRGACYRDGSLYFLLSDNKLCSGVYNDGQAKLLCNFDNDEYCLINMTTMDGSRLTCVGSKIKAIRFLSILCFLLLIYIRKN